MQIQGELGAEVAGAAGKSGKPVGFVRMFSSIARTEGLPALQKGLVPSLLRVLSQHPLTYVALCRCPLPPSALSDRCSDIDAFQYDLTGVLLGGVHTVLVPLLAGEKRFIHLYVSLPTNRCVISS